jgi:hypothetical protein
MPFRLSALALMLLAVPAVAQTSNSGQNPASYMQNMQAADAARLNQAAQSDPRTRDALDQVEKRLNEANHPAGRMLEQTRP